MFAYDVIVIGAGVSGACAARELARYKLRIAVLEKDQDLCAGASKGNSATVHSGHDAAYGTKKPCTMYAAIRCTDRCVRNSPFPSEETEPMYLQSRNRIWRKSAV